jgi:hypothetical protein
MSNTDIAAAADTFAAAKIAYTAQLAALAAKRNALPQQPVTDADWANLITGFYDPMTSASNALRALIANFTVGISNLTDAAVTTLDQNPLEDYAAAYAVLANVLIFCPDKASALAIVELLYADLKADIAAYYDALPDGPTPSLLVNSMNSLQAVLAA